MTVPLLRLNPRTWCAPRCSLFGQPAKCDPGYCRCRARPGPLSHGADQNTVAGAQHLDSWDLLNQAEQIIQLWLERPNPLRVTLIVLRIHVVELLSRQSSAVKGKATRKIKQAPSPKGTRRISLPILRCCIGTSSCLIMQLRFCTWPRICTLQSWSHFTLDISKLFRDGLISVQKVLSQSNLERLHVVCTLFDLSLSNAIADVLNSVQQPMLKSLVLSGSHINN